jgi:hypothetical protein
MKKSLLTLAFVSATALSALGQGAIDFRNATSQLPEPPDRRVRTFEGTPVIGTQFSAQLFFASDASNPNATAAVVEAPSAFRASALPGFWAGGTRTLVGVLPGVARDYVVRVWDSTLGSYAQAVASGRVNAYGQSLPFSYTPPTDPTAPPSAFTMQNFVGFQLVPEPSTIALGILGGIGTLVLLRRRK